MARRIKVSELARFDMADYLGNPEAIADYLNIVLEEGDPDAFMAALGTAARARGMTQVAELTGLSRESLYKALRAGAAPRFDTIQRVMAALGVNLAAYAASQSADAA